MKQRMMIATMALLAGSISWAQEGVVEAPIIEVPVVEKAPVQLQWVDAMPTALAKAQAERKSIFVDFTGTDWCPGCIYLRTKIMDQPEFIAQVQDRYVMLELDYPRDKNKFSQEKQDANEALRVKYGVESFPTVLLLDHDGLPFAQLVGASKEVPDYLLRLAEAEALLEQRNAAWNHVAGSGGLEEAQRLDAMLQTVPESLRRHYEKVIVTIISNDPEDTLGYAKNMAAENLRLQQKVAFEKLRDSGRGKIQPEQILEEIQQWGEFVKISNLDQDIEQAAWYQLSFLHAMVHDYAANVKCLRKAYEASPESKEAKKIHRWLEHNEKNLPALLERTHGATADQAVETDTKSDETTTVE